MLAQLASLASLARVRPLITHQAYQLARAWGSHPLWTSVGRKEIKMSWEWRKDTVSHYLLLCGNHLKKSVECVFMSVPK